MADDITAEYVLPELLEAPTLNWTLQLTVACKTDLGRVRDNNEDKFEYYIPSDAATLARRGNAFLVCDGMGGHNAGQIASELACKTFLEVYYSHPAADPAAAAVAATDAANRYVRDVGLAIPSRRGMGTTLSGLILIQDQALIVQVGDSRTYRLRQGELRQLSPEHTWIEEVIANGIMSREEAEAHPYKHVITRAIGTEPTVPVDVLPETLEAGDLFLLCSDGLTNHVKDPRLCQLLQEFGPSEAAWKLVAEALADGGSDNCTALIVRVDSITPLN